MFGKIPERKFFENISIQDSLLLKWSAETNGGQSCTSIVIYNNILFVSDLSGRIYAFDRTTGKLFGYEKYSGSIPVAPVVNDLRIFFIVNDFNERTSTLNIFDFINGKVLYESKIFGGVNSEMLKLKDGIVVLTTAGELIKFNLVNTREWSVPTKVTAKSSPASDGELILFGNEKGELIAVSAKDGSIKYRTKISDGIEGSITIDEVNAYFGDNNGNIFSVKASDGKINWCINTNHKIISTPVYNENKIYIGNLAGEIFCLNKTDGKLIWKIQVNGVVNTTPLLFKNYLVQPDLNRKVHFINTQTGKIEKTIEYERRVKLSPVYYGGIIYMGADRGIINAYQTFSTN